MPKTFGETEWGSMSRKHLRPCIMLSLIVALTGCAPAVAPTPDPRPTSASSETTWTAVPTVDAAMAPGPVIDGLIHDRSADAEDSAIAEDELRSVLAEQLKTAYEYGPPEDRRLPRSQKKLLSGARVVLVPVCVVTTSSSDATSVFPITRQLLSNYVGIVRYEGESIGGFDWYRPRAEPGAVVNEMWPDWFTFYGPFGLGFPEAEQRLRDHFGTASVRVRIISVPRGWWMVGRAGDDERGVFVQHQGSFEDDPRYDRLYTVSEILEYGAPHADGK